MRCFIHKSFSSELFARKHYLEDVFGVYFIIAADTHDFSVLQTFPLNMYDNICIVIGHAQNVHRLLKGNLFSLEEQHIFLVTCSLNQRHNLRVKDKHVYICPDQRNGYIFPRDGSLYGFDFNPTDAEIRLYNNPGLRDRPALEVLQSVFQKL